jgi:hypothetical protein
VPSRAARLADRRAAELLAGAASAAAGPTLVWAAPGGFPPPTRATGGAVTIVAASGVDAARAVADDGGPPGDERYARVIDTTRPEAVAGDAVRIARLVRACRPGGTVALVAVGGPVLPPDLRTPCDRAGPPHGGATRTLATAAAALAAAGAWVEGAVAFDLVGPFAPWRHALGGDADAVLAELDRHLRARAVRAMARLLDRELVSQLPPESTARAVLVARRVAPGDTGGARAVRDDPHDRLDAPATTARLLGLLQDDAVVRFAAFVDAEILGRLDVPFSIVRWLTDASLRPGAGERAAVRARRANREWYPGVDAYRLVQAASHRIATRTAAVLGKVSAESAVVAPTLEYALIEMVNAALDRRLTEVPGTR